MPRRFFRLLDDVYVPKRWHLGSPLDAQGREIDDFGHLTQGHAVQDPGRLHMACTVRGRPLDYSLGGLNVPILHPRVAQVFTELAPSDVQLLPVEIARQSEPYSILVVTRRIQCIDEQASGIERWTTEDDRPEMVGQYRFVSTLRLDSSRIGDARVFRPEDWEVVIVISEEIKEALERIRATGVKFTEVPCT
jgi:hypothetical protein